MEKNVIAFIEQQALLKCIVLVPLFKSLANSGFYF